MAGSTRWECIKNNLPGNKQTWSSGALPGCWAGHSPELSPKSTPDLEAATVRGLSHRSWIQWALLPLPAEIWESEFPGDSFPSGLHRRQGLSPSCRAIWEHSSWNHPYTQTGMVWDWELVVWDVWAHSQAMGLCCGQPQAPAPDCFYTIKTHRRGFVGLIYIKKKEKSKSMWLLRSTSGHRGTGFIHKSKIYIYT